MWRVLKLGGSVLNDKNVKKLKSIFKEACENTIYVVSALKGITDSLEEFISDSRSVTEVKAFCNDFYLRHLSFLRNFSVSFPQNLQDISRSLEKELRRYFLQKNEENLASVLAFGEKASAAVMNSILNSFGLPSKVLHPDKAYLRTADNDFLNAKLDVSYCKSHLKLENGVFVIPGFFATNSNGKVTLLGRNGSDYTAAVITVALGANSIEFYKDVSMMSCDPKLVSKSFAIQNLTYEEAEELAFSGAKILHPLAVRLLKEREIKIKIYSVNSSLDKPSTVIEGHGVKNERVSAVALENVSVLNLKLNDFEYNDVLSDLLTGSNIKNATTSPTAVRVILNKNEEKKFLNFLSSGKFEFNFENGLSLITLTGKMDFRKIMRISSALMKKGIEIKSVSFNTSGVAAYLAVEAEKAKNAVQIIHKEIFEKGIAT